MKLTFGTYLFLQHFAANNYFETDVLSKVFHYNEDSELEVSGCEIAWKDGMVRSLRPTLWFPH